MLPIGILGQTICWQDVPALARKETHLWLH